MKNSPAFGGPSLASLRDTFQTPVPGLIATFLFVLVFAWNEYLSALFLSSSNAPNATRGPQWWYMSVLVLIMIVPVIVIAIGLERYVARGLLVGATKG